MTAPTKSTLPLVGGGIWYNTNREYRLESSQTTTTSVFYELYTNGNGDAQFGIEIKNDNKMYVMTSNNTGNPHIIAIGNFVAGQSSISIAPNNRISLYHNDGTLLGQIDVDTSMLWSGPTVTSITEDTIFVPSDTVSNTDFTLLKNGSAYANTNISLTGPGPQPPSDARGYTYSLTYNGTALYSRTIDSKSFHDLYYDDSWTSSPTSSRSTNSSRILAVLGTLPITANFTVPTIVGQTIGTRTFHDLNRSMRVILTYPAGSTHTQFICYFHVSEINNEIKGKFQSHTLNAFVFDESPFFTIGAQQTMSHTFTINGSNITISVNDWVYSDEPEGDGYVAPVTTTSNGGGKRRRYPIISTNLFDRQRSIYSIGLTHKDDTLF